MVRNLDDSAGECASEREHAFFGIHGNIAGEKDRMPEGIEFQNERIVILFGRRFFGSVFPVRMQNSELIPWGSKAISTLQGAVDKICRQVDAVFQAAIVPELPYLKIAHERRKP